MSSREVSLLLVGDDLSTIQAMGRMLGQYPDQRFATSGEAALRLARETTPDLIVLDVDMPGMTGFDVCEALKADPLLADVPVIFTSNSDAAALLQLAARQDGATDPAAEPLSAVQLNARVRAELQLHARQPVEDDDPEHGAAAAPAAAPRRTSPQAPRLLIVDDDTASIHILRHTLATMGDIHFAKTGEEALRLARRLVPDLILLDAHMPGLDGFDVCKSLKAEALFRHVPIVFVTRFSDPRHEMRALDLGAADFIAKPYTRAVLRARVRNLLDLKRRTDTELQAVREHWRRVGDARVADIVSAASDAIVTYDADHKTVLINVAACCMFGITHEQAIELPAQALLGDVVSAAERWPANPGRATLARASGAGFVAEVSVSSVGDGAGRLTTVMLRDIGDRDRERRETAELPAPTTTQAGPAGLTTC